MIRNIVFDMGNVLINYDPAHFVARLGLENPEDEQLLLREIFQSPDWARQDRGEIGESGLYALVCGRLPARLHGAAEELIFRWNEPIEPIGGMDGLVKKCKDAGLGVYLLSNASVRQREYWDEIPGSELFDGRIISAEVKCVKPGPEIYGILLERFGLKAEESVFVDDMPANVEGAKRAGLRGILFDGDPDALERALRESGAAL